MEQFQNQTFLQNTILEQPSIDSLLEDIRIYREPVDVHFAMDKLTSISGKNGMLRDYLKNPENLEKVRKAVLSLVEEGGYLDLERAGRLSGFFGENLFSFKSETVNPKEAVSDFIQEKLNFLVLDNKNRENFSLGRAYSLKSVIYEIIKISKNYGLNLNLQEKSVIDSSLLDITKSFEKTVFETGLHEDYVKIYFRELFELKNDFPVFYEEYTTLNREIINDFKKSLIDYKNRVFEEVDSLISKLL